jgi:predicted dinucleotide-binding enzyme
MKKEVKKLDITVTDEGKVVVDLKGAYDYNGVNVLMDKLKKAQSAASELLKLAKRKELLKANFK